LAATGLVACGGDDDGGDEVTRSDGGDDTTEADGSDDTSAGDAATTTAPASPEDQAVAAYEQSWDATFSSTASDPPEVAPEIEDLMTGEALSETLNHINTLAREGRRVEGSIETHPQVASVTSSEVILEDCAVENSVAYEPGGEAGNRADGVAFNYKVTVVNEGGTWKVADFELREETCTPG
jgi:hypothetical protein